VNSLPKTVTRQCRDCDLNPGPSAPESSTLTTRLLLTAIALHSTRVYTARIHGPCARFTGRVYRCSVTQLARYLLKASSQRTNLTKLSLTNWTAALEYAHVLRTNRALTDPVSMQPIRTKYSRDCDARDQ